MNKKLLLISFLLTFFALSSGVAGLYLIAQGRLDHDQEEEQEESGRTRQDILENASSWAYSRSLQEKDIEILTSSTFDVIVADPNHLAEEDITTIKGEKETLVLSYLSIVKAENSRYYWQKGWKPDNVKWIVKKDKDHKGSYIINFWSEDWKTIMKSYIDQLMLRGYDGVNLHIDGIDYWVESDEVLNAEVLLIQLIEELTAYAHEKQSDFIVIPHNLGFLHHDYAQRLAPEIDAVSQQEVFYGYNGIDGVETPFNISAQIQSKLNAYKEREKHIFTLDFPFSCSSDSSCYDQLHQKRMMDISRKHTELGYISYIHNRNANGVSFVVPQITQATSSFDNVVVFSWEVSSPNDVNPQNAYRIFVSSSEEKSISSNPDIYDSGRLWTGVTSFGFIPDSELEDGSYFWKIVVYDYVDGVTLLSEWSNSVEFSYEMPSSPKPLIQKATTQTAWIPSWGFETGFDSLKESKQHFSSISPVWFVVGEDGSLSPDGYYNNSDFISYCKKNDIDIIPSLPLFTSEVLSTVLNEHLDSHVSNIMDEVEKGGYDGIDIDYESTFLNDKELYFTFLRRLSERLHDQGKVLSVTVLSKWTDQLIYGFLPETRQVQDWERIGRYADEVRIMAYDYTAQNSYLPGSISPIYWDELIINYALTKLPREKIVIALPLYAYSFRIDERSTISQDIFVGGEPAGSEKRVLAYTYDDIKAIQNDFEFQLSYDETTMDRVISYHDGTFDRVLYYTDARGIKSRRSLAYDYGIKGVAYWRLGSDDSKSYE